MSRPDIGRYGVFTALAGQDPAVQAEAAGELEALGFGTVWLGNASVEQAVPILAATSTLVVGTGIQSIWGHPAASTAARYAEVEAAHPGRFVLGLGVGHPQMVEGYRRPYSAMAAYLDELDGAVPAERRMLAALGPRMLRLSGDRAAGALPYLVTAEQVAAARETLGAGPLLAPELGVVLESDPGRARALARDALSVYLGLTNYSDNWLRGGFTEADLADGGSDRLVDALFAWGDDERIRARVDAFRAAGADQVVVQLVDDLDRAASRVGGWRRLAAVLP